MKLPFSSLLLVIVTQRTNAADDANDAPNIRANHNVSRQMKNLFRNKELPASQGSNNGNGGNQVPLVPSMTVPSVDRAKVAAEDADREDRGDPMRFAIGNQVSINPTSDGTWSATEDGTQVWQYRMKSPGCNSMNFGFDTYEMPKGGKLYICKCVKIVTVLRDMLLALTHSRLLVHPLSILYHVLTQTTPREELPSHVPLQIWIMREVSSGLQ